MKRFAISLEKDHLFYAFYIVLVAICAWLNWNNEIMGSILSYYFDFSRFFQSGLSSEYIFVKNNPTFPMWGYGLILLILKHKFVIVFLQLLLMLFVVYEWDKYMHVITGEKVVFRKIVLLGVCFVFFNVPLWPYSIGCNAILLAILCLFKAHKSYKLKYILLSAILFGIALNFRSDYFYFAMVLPILILGFKWFWQTSIPYLIPFFYYPIIFILMLPWLIHTNNMTGHYSFTSTNAGHVMFVSLGQLPSNPWGITPLDSDKKMKEIVLDELGNENTLSAEANIILKDAFIKEVKTHPGAYLKKCVFNLYFTAIRPFSNGQLERRFINDDEEIFDLRQKLKKDIKSFNFKELIRGVFNGTYAAFILSIVLNILNILLWFFFLFNIFRGLIKHRLKLLSQFDIYISLAIIAYQMTLQTLFFYHPNYHTNVFIFYVVCVVLIKNLSREKSEEIIA